MSIVTSPSSCTAVSMRAEVELFLLKVGRRSSDGGGARGAVEIVENS